MDSIDRALVPSRSRVAWERFTPSLVESREGILRTLAVQVQGKTEKTRKAILVGMVREHHPSRSLARCGTIVRRGAPGDDESVRRSTCRSLTCPACGGWNAERRARETFESLPKDAVVVMLTLTSRDRREASIAQRWEEADLLWRTAFTESKWLQRHLPNGGVRRFPCLTFTSNVFGDNPYLPHPHHHVVVALTGVSTSDATAQAKNMIQQYVRAAHRLGIEVSLPGQHWLVADDPRRVVRYASKAMGFVIGHDDDDGRASVTLAELGVIAASTGDQDALDRWVEAMTDRPHLAPPAGLLRPRR